MARCNWVADQSRPSRRLASSPARPADVAREQKTFTDPIQVPGERAMVLLGFARGTLGRQSMTAGCKKLVQ
jgi:hypothetical protein